MAGVQSGPFCAPGGTFHFAAERNSASTHVLGAYRVEALTDAEDRHSGGAE